MKRSLLSLLLAFAAWGTFVTAETLSTLHLTLDLADGSRVIGTTTLTTLPVRSEALGKIEIPLAQVRTVKFSRDHELLTVGLTNGDRLQGNLGEMKLQVQTLMGLITLPVEQVTTISVAVPATKRTRFSAAEDFSPDNNPNGAWSYGRRAKLDGEFQLYTQKQTDPNLPGLVAWQDNNNPPSVGKNTGERPLHPDNSMTYLPGQLGFHPGSQGQCSVIRWTAPRPGRYQVRGEFKGLSGYQGQPPTTTDVHVYHNTRSVFDAGINVQGRGNEAPFDLSVDVKTGDTIDFVVGFGNGNYGWDTTGLDAVITIKGDQP